MTRILGLDGIRAFAVLIVFFHHLGIIPFLTLGGHVGVDIFFVLSGFLIASILINTNHGLSNNLFVFYRKRALRLLPALFFFVLVIGCFINFVNQPRWTIDKFNETIPALFNYMNWIRVLNIYDAPYTGHTWSLSVEWQFYLIFPALLIFLLRKFDRKAIYFLLSIIAIQVFWRAYLSLENDSASRVYCGFDTHSDGLLVGGGLAMMVYYRYDKALKMLSSLAPIGLIFFIWVLLFQNGAKFVDTSFGLLLTNICAVSIVAFIVSHQESCVVKFLEWKPLAFLGVISYGFYLWHYPVVKIMLYSGYDGFGAFFGSFDHAKYMIVLCTFLVTLCFTLFSWHVIEKPFLKLKNKKYLKCK